MTPFDLLLLLGGTVAKGAAILLLAAGASRLLRRRSAAGRYAVWAVAFGGLLLLPALTLVLPEWSTPALSRRTTSVPADDVGSSMAAMQVATGMEAGDNRAPGGHSMTENVADDRMLDAPVSARGREISWRVAVGPFAPWMLALWLAGVLTVLARLLRDVIRISRVSRRAAVQHRGQIYDLGRQVAAELGLRRRIAIACSREIEMPVTLGLIRPVILLPDTAHGWDAPRRLVVLRHELAHIRRNDYAAHLLIELACAIHWLNPFAWRAAHRARLEQEQACDDRVLALGTRSIEYAQQLLDLARSYALPVAPVRGALAMAAAATLPRRMRAILDVGVDHRPVRPRTLLAVVAIGLLVGVPTAALHPWTDAGAKTDLVSLSSPDPLVRRQAVWSLGMRRWTGARAALVEHLGDSDPVTRGMAAWALGRLVKRDALAPLVTALRDRDAQVREMAVLALGELGDPRAVPALMPLASDPEHGVRSVMTVALKQIGGEEASGGLARLVRSDSDAHTRVMAASALSLVEGPRGVRALEAALADPDPDVRCTAASSLEKLSDPASVPALLAALAREKDGMVREALVHAAGAFHDRRATPALVGVLLTDSPRLRESAALMLGEIGDATAAGALMTATRDPEHRVRLTAVRSLNALHVTR